MKTEVYFLLGSNLGDRQINLQKSIEQIALQIGNVLKKSSVYLTEPWGKKDQPEFMNMVVMAETELNADTVLRKILQIEKELGREREEKWGARVIDIDILFYGKEIIVKKDLKIPHPEIQNRKFTLIPLAEIAPELKHPVLNVTVKKLLERCEDDLRVIEVKK